LTGPDIQRFLDHLVETGVSASTHQQALCAIIFLYSRVLGTRPPWIDKLARPAKPKRLPTVLTKGEVRAVLAQLRGVPKLMAALLYGSGLRVLECARLRIKDIDFAAVQLVVRDGKGRKDRLTLLPEALRQPLQEHLSQVRTLHNDDLAVGAGRVALPGALAR
jgi:site-specific recombinase XerD